jgi:hypothetical protein
VDDSDSVITKVTLGSFCSPDGYRFFGDVSDGDWSFLVRDCGVRIPLTEAFLEQADSALEPDALRDIGLFGNHGDRWLDDTDVDPDPELEDGHPGELCCEDDANLCSDGDPGVGYNWWGVPGIGFGDG